MGPILRLPLMRWTKTMKLAKMCLNLIPTLTNKLKKDTFPIRNIRVLATLTMTFCYQIRLPSWISLRTTKFLQISIGLQILIILQIFTCIKAKKKEMRLLLEKNWYRVSKISWRILRSISIKSGLPSRWYGIFLAQNLLTQSRYQVLFKKNFRRQFLLFNLQNLNRCVKIFM